MNALLALAVECGTRRRAGYDVGLVLAAGLLFILGLAPFPVLAQAVATKAPPPTHRCLLVVETSKSMQRRSDAVLQVVQDMLKSGLDGQMRRGDTLGIWTYNESLYSGRFPLQTWSPEAQNDITLRVLAFLKDQKYEKQPSFDKVLPALNRVTEGSPLITIILLSSADEKLHGTAFDERLNQFYQKWHDQQQKARMPFVTVLRAQDGRLTDFTVNTPPFPVQMPHLTRETQSAETIQSKLLEAVRSVPPATAPPLILSGKKPQPEQAPSAKPEPAIANTAAPVPAPAAPGANPALTVKPLAPTVQSAQIAKTEAAPVVPAQPPVVLPTEPSPAPVPIPEPKAELPKAPEAKPIAAAVAAPPTASTRPLTAPAPQPVAIEPSKPTPVPVPEPVQAPKPVAEPKVELVKAPEPGPVAPIPAKTEAVAALPALAPKTAPVPPATQPAVPVARTDAAPPASTRSVSVSPRPAPASNPPAQTATAVPAEALGRNRGIWIAGLVLAAGAIAGALLLLRRSRSPASGSLITQSFERKHKP